MFAGGVTNGGGVNYTPCHQPLAVASESVAISVTGSPHLSRSPKGVLFPQPVDPPGLLRSPHPTEAGVDATADAEADVD